MKKNKPTFCLWAEASQHASGDWAENELWLEPRHAGSPVQLGNNLGGVLRLGSNFRDGSDSTLSAGLSLIYGGAPRLGLQSSELGVEGGRTKCSAVCKYHRRGFTLCKQAAAHLGVRKLLLFLENSGPYK